MCFKVYEKVPLLVLCCVMVACGRSGPEIEYSRTIDFRTTDTLFMRDRVEDIEFLPLEMTDEAVFSVADKTVFRNGLVYIFDFRNSRIVVYDDSTGEVRFVIDRRGRGPGEYLEIRSFAVNDRYLYTVDNYTARVNLYDCMTGDFRKTLDAPFYVSNIEALDNGDMILAYIPTPGDNIAERPPRYRLFITDGDLNVRKRLFPLEKGYCDPAAVWNYFTRDSGRIIFGSFYFDGFTLIDGTTEEYAHIAVNLDRPVPARLRQDIESIQTSSCQYILNTPVVAGDYIVAVVNERFYGQEYLYDPYTGYFLQNSRTTAENGILPSVIGSKDGKIVSLLTDYGLYEDAVKHGFKRMPAEYEARLAAGEYVLLFYTMK